MLNYPTTHVRVMGVMDAAIFFFFIYFCMSWQDRQFDLFFLLIYLTTFFKGRFPFSTNVLAAFNTNIFLFNILLLYFVFHKNTILV